MDESNDTGADIDVPDLPEVAAGADDTTDWKATALKMQGMAKRFKTKIDKMATAPKSTTPAPTAEAAQASTGFDYAQKAYLKASGIESSEFDFVKEVMEATGKTDIDAVLGSKYFQAELKERRELKATADATPSGTKRAGNQTRNDVEYWLAKGGLPKDNPALATKVVNARIASEKKARFAPNSVVTNTPVA